MGIRFLASLVLLTGVGCRAAPAAAPSKPTAAPIASTSLTYLGVAGWQLTSGASSLLVDPYFTRLRVTDDAAPLGPDVGAVTQFAPKQADAILVTHSHYDHLLDVPTIALRTAAVVVGSESTLNVARASGIPASRLDLAVPNELTTVGPFAIRPLHAEHALTGQTFGTIPPAPSLPMPASGYRVGETLQYFVTVGGRSVLFIGTANLVDASLAGLRPDVAVIAVGLREKIPDYACRLMRLLGEPPLVFTNHFDDHRAPVTATGPQLDDEDRTDLAAFEREIHACAPATRVVVPRYFTPIAL